MRSFLSLTILAAALLGAGPAPAAEVRVLTAGAFKAVLLDLVPEFERGGHRIVLANDTVGGLVRRIEGGERFDLVVLTPAAVAELAAKGRVAAGTGVDLARVGIGVAVREGAPRPDIASVETFTRALREAPSVAYIDPAAGGTSGIYLAGLFGRLGLAEAVGRKAVLVPGGLVGERVASGEAALGLQQISEVLTVKGTTYVGPLPAEVQSYTTYAGGIASAAREPEAARALLAFLRSEAARRVLTAKGMEPPRG